MVKGTAAQAMLKRLDKERSMKGTTAMTSMFKKVHLAALQ
jgi:hypothetical protein